MALLLEEKLNEHASWALWHISESEEVLKNMVQLSPGEQQELSAVRHENRRLEWLASRILVKQLARERQMPSAEMLKDTWGKPFLSGRHAFISLSHSFPYAAAIINTTKEVGIDIEQSRSQLLRIRHKFLNQEELSWAGNDLQKLCLYWTAKEALYKIHGKRGLSFQENILISPFKPEEKGLIQARLLTKQVNQSFTLHYRCFKGFYICFSL